MVVELLGGGGSHHRSSPPPDGYRQVKDINLASIPADGPAYLDVEWDDAYGITSDEVLGDELGGAIRQDGYPGHRPSFDRKD